MKKSLIIKVYGKVQNVGFRFYTERAAGEFQICGFVRNVSDGSVYIEAEGEADAVDAFMEWCRQGPKWARVDRLEIQSQPLQGYQGFKVK
jgi:acylphosphatase